MKFLLTTSAFKDCCARIMAAYLEMISSFDFAEFIKFTRKIPEIDSLLTRIHGL